MNRLKIGFIGMRFGLTVLEGVMAGHGIDLIEPVAVCDLEKDKADAAAEKFGLRAYCDFEQMLTCEKLDAVALYTPPAGRAGLIRTLLERGLDIMTTKPFEIEPEAARDVLEFAGALGRVVHLNSPGPVQNGLVRAVNEASVKYDLGIPAGFRQDIWVNYDEKADGGWYDDPARCPAAPIFRLGIYILNDMVRIFGRAESVCVQSSRLLTGRPTADNALISIKFENGALGSIYGSFCIDDSLRYNSPLTINYQRGTFMRGGGPEGGGQLTLTMRDPSDERYNPKKHVVHTLETSGPGSGSYNWQEFVRCVREKKPASPEYIGDITSSLEIIRAMTLSERTGTLVKI